jgi:replicative DNA helicase
MTGQSKPFPSDAMIERRVLEALVSLAAESIEVLDLDPECFYLPLHRRVFEACKTLHSHRRSIDAVLVLGQLDGDAEARSFVASLGFPDLSNLGTWCDTLRDLRTLRRVQETALRVATAGYEHARDAGPYLDHASQQLTAAFDGRSTGITTDTIGDLTGQVLADYDARKANAPTRTVSTGFNLLDGGIGGLEPGRLYVVAGRPGSGKSSLANQLALHVAMQQHLSLVFNLEMKPKEVVRRVMSLSASVDSKAIKNATATDEQLRRLTSKSSELGKLRVEFPRCVDITIEQTRRIARGRARDGMRLVVVDYLQLIKSGEKHDNREQQVSAVSRGLKAMELEVPVVAAAQLNRESDRRSNQRPNMSDLRESGAIEQDADVVMLLYRDEYYNAQTKEPNTCEVIVAKNRDGETGVIKMGFEARYTRFSDHIPQVRNG